MTLLFLRLILGTLKDLFLIVDFNLNIVQKRQSLASCLSNN